MTDGRQPVAAAGRKPDDRQGFNFKLRIEPDLQASFDTITGLVPQLLAVQALLNWFLKQSLNEQVAILEKEKPALLSKRAKKTKKKIKLSEIQKARGGGWQTKAS